MGDQTFYTPNFGDEVFDTLNINQQQQHVQQGHNYQPHYQPPMQQMNQQMNQQQHTMGRLDPMGGYQQPLYLSGPEHGMTGQQYHNPQPNYSMSSSQQASMTHQQMMMNYGQPMGQYGASPQHPQERSNGPPAPGQVHNTCHDSSNSTVHPAMLPPIQPLVSELTNPKAQKKRKVQKKKDKRDPNEPQKPVSAYSLFFRDTHAALKGQNPNANFGEVSKIVASMWDALDSEHKNVYKNKTDAAKKEYLQALAAYKASVVSKEAGEVEGRPYATGPSGGYQHPGTIPSPPMSFFGAPTSHSPSYINNNVLGGDFPALPHPGMMPSPNGRDISMRQVPHNAHMRQEGQQSQQQQISMSPPSMVSYSPPRSPGGIRPRQITCIRNGCTNPAIINPEWEDEYCSNECAVSHCRDVFSNWAAGRQQNLLTIE
ncbi:unnamed protein product [Ceutorhynchus assimilis]|uniref:HMG box domain-containing protein n=1 Tax=Ceutorhynchus assimilis TaxID=467358 RepID=A0A9N9MNP5_9CUCU|nr:unnamed protein product [Ceutorhynchus assimilis]